MKKLFVLFSGFLMLVISILVLPGPVSAVLLFEDDFNDAVIDSTKWTLANVGHPHDGSLVGNYTAESDGALTLYQNQTDFGGRVISAPITVNPTGIITLTLRTYPHYNRSVPQFRGTYMVRDQDGNNIAGFTHYHYDYIGWHGFGVTTEHDPVSDLLPEIWDQWFEQTLTLNPVTGEITYTVGNNSVSYSGTPFTTASISLDFHSYGWFTGHYTSLDWVRLEQDGTTCLLSVNTEGTGTGTVTSAPSGISCGNTCSGAFNSGTQVVLTATADAGSTFGGWQGCVASSDNQCTVTMNAAKTVTATFDLEECTYSITPTDNQAPASEATGTVTVTASSRDCEGSWTAESNEPWVTITSGHSGNESGTIGYSVSANETSLERTGTISVAGQTFTVIQSAMDQRTLSVNVVGQGTVASEPEGIVCGTDCSEDYAQGSAVVLTATPSAGAAFEGWSGGECTGIGPCTVTLSADIEVSARFSALRSIKLGPQVLMAGFDPILLDLSTTRFSIIALVREGNQPIGSVSITDNLGFPAFALNLLGRISNGDLLYGAELSIPRGPNFSFPNLFGSEPGQILIKAVDTAGLSHGFPTIVYGNNPDLAPMQESTDAPGYARRGCKRLPPQVLMAGLEPTLLDFDDTELKVMAMVREGARPIQDVSLKINNSPFNLAMDLVETLENGDRIYEKAIVFQRGAFGHMELSFQNLWGGGSNQFMVEVRDDAGQRHSFPDIRRGDYRTINAAECWSDQ